MEEARLVCYCKHCDVTSYFNDYVFRAVTMAMIRCLMEMGVPFEPVEMAGPIKRPGGKYILRALKARQIVASWGISSFHVTLILPPFVLTLPNLRHCCWCCSRSSLRLHVTPFHCIWFFLISPCIVTFGFPILFYKTPQICVSKMHGYICDQFSCMDICFD